jgi:hypothetical protein
MAGYSGKPLAQKLGIRPGHRISLHGAPPSFPHVLGELAEGVTFEGSRATKLDMIMLFADRASNLERSFAPAAKRLVSNGMLWIAWPKKASGVATDLTEDVVRRIGLAAGLVDVKVCAVDETWSGLKFVLRLENRGRETR